LRVGPDAATVACVEDLLERATIAYDLAVFQGNRAALPATIEELRVAEAAICLARGRLLHAQFMQDWDRDASYLAEEYYLFNRAAEIYRAIGDVRGEAESVFFVGCFHQVVRDNNPSALPFFARALELSTEIGDDLIRSYALRHLGISAHATGNLPDARRLLEESTELRRRLGFISGVASNLVGLAYVARAAGRRAEADALIAESAELAEASGANAILRQAAAFHAEAAEA
jgi:tetratricopeptide (TPR) repeat protein